MGFIVVTHKTNNNPPIEKPILFSPKSGWTSRVCGSIFHKDFVSPCQTINQHPNYNVLHHLREQVHRNVWNVGRTRTGCLILTMCWCTLLCLHNSFWLLKMWLWSPTLLSCLIWPHWFFVFYWGENRRYKGVISRMLLKVSYNCCLSYVWFQKSLLTVPKMLDLLHSLWRGQQWSVTKASIYFCTNSVWEPLDTTK